MHRTESRNRPKALCGSVTEPYKVWVPDGAQVSQSPQGSKEGFPPVRRILGAGLPLQRGTIARRLFDQDFIVKIAEVHIP